MTMVSVQQVAFDIFLAKNGIYTKTMIYQKKKMMRMKKFLTDLYIVR